MNISNDSLWLLIAMAYDSSPNARDGAAAVLRVLADEVAPEEIEPPSPEGEPWPQSYQLMSDSKWEQRQMIRQYLLDEANKAEMEL